MAEHSTKHTFIYKYYKGYAYKMDCYLPDETKFGMVANVAQQIMSGKKASSNAEADHRLPALVYWHGGGMVSGNREKNEWAPRWLFKDALNAGFVVLSPDYTLLSPHTAHHSLTDAIDLFTFLSKTSGGLNEQLSRIGGQLLDPERVAVAGSSAGGYMTYLSGTHCVPKPKALVPIYAMGGDFFSPIYLQKKSEPFFSDFGTLPLLPEEPWRTIYNTPITNPPLLSTSLDPIKEPRINYPAWLVQHAIILDALTGVKGLTERLREVEGREEMERVVRDEKGDGGGELGEAVRLFPQLLLLSNEQPFPPTKLLHGTKDTMVLIHESRSFRDLLVGRGIECDLVEVEGAGHGFDAAFEDSKGVKGLEGIMQWVVGKVGKGV